MAPQRRLPAAPWLALFLVGLAIPLSFTCPNCYKSFDTLSCSMNATFAQQYKLELKDDNGTTDSLLSLRCDYRASHLDLAFHKGCNFSSVQHVSLSLCPLFNVSFSKAFAELGILPEKILQVTFDNRGVRTDLKLERWHLDGLTNLEFLDLKNTKFTTIPPDLLQATPKLQHFFFSQANMSTVPETLFAGASHLKSIHLINNNFESLPDNLFSNIFTLTGLTVYGNTLGEISPKLLSSIPKVYQLELSINKIRKITSDTFLNLPKLKTLYLKINELESLPEDIFHNCPDLETVNLQYNKLQALPSQLFSKSKMITDLSFSNNKIIEIPQGLFQGLINLTELSMSANALEKIPEGSFADLISLEKLSLNDNPLKTLLSGTFNSHHKLKTLDLKNASLSDLPSNIFKTCESLEEIDLSDNHLSELRSTFFPHPITVLRILRLGNNNLSFSTIVSKPEAREAGRTDEVLLEQFPLSDQVGLTELTLNSNRIKAIPHAFRNLQNLMQLDLRNNSIEYLDNFDFLWNPDHGNLDRSNASQAERQDLNSDIPKRVVGVKLRDNPLICDCNLYKFARLLQEKNSEQDKNMVHLEVEDSNAVKCSPPNNRSDQKLVMTLDFTKLFCYRKECHPSCSCAIRPHDHMFIMDCASQGLQAIPKLKPYLPKGNYSITLSVTNNSIASLEGLQSPSYNNLVNLTIPSNHLKVINESYLPKTLQVLDVRRNYLTNFCPSVISFLNATNANLGLGGNPWLCDCQLVDLHVFLRDPKRKLADSHSILCSNLNKQLLSLTEEELCPTIQRPMVVATIASTTVLLVVFFVLGTVVVFNFQQEIKVWLFNHRMCLWAVAKEEADANKKYDAFISYSNKDEEYVNTVLVPGLECGEPRYRVCLHYRDWVPGEYIQNQIDQSIEDSHRTIVVLSSNFIENVWGQIEFKTAHSKALREKSKKIIVIVLGQVPPESEMDEELKLYLSTRTYLQSDHPKFWENLRYAMPHPQEFFQKKQNKTKKTERLELVHKNAKPK
uniref:Toll-like receptor n=1 Tax=Eriocheir sinensis TaxID=95602 RepID=U3LV87_ERISI|nr:toll-like receptor [Eriocheir sinensis]